ncbi:MAG: TraB/GumN family protein [Burkholderiales bacterium]
MTTTLRRLPGWAARLFTKERDLRMVWEVESKGRRSALVGTAHFFPYRFRASMRGRIARADVVLLEGPLDENSRRKVIAAGSVRRGASLPDALDAETMRRINAILAAPSAPAGTSAFYWSVLHGNAPLAPGGDIRQLEPWMAFFHIWTEYRRRDGWIYSVDLDAAATAAALRKDVRTLETIEEQITTLGRIPLERIVSFLKSADWEAYRRDYVRHYLDGNLAALMDMARAFPSYCEPVIEERAPLLLERMMPFLESGKAVAFVGIMHCRGLTAQLRAHGYAVTGPAVP